MKHASKTSAVTPARQRIPVREPASTHPSLEGVSGAVKRAIDVAGSFAALIVLSPLLAALAAIVRLMDGAPVFYTQTRVGLRGREFTIVKIRTMHPDAEAGIGPIWSLKEDPRCTVFGAWLRRRGLDELPQLWNILLGDMSFVGPRPERPKFVNEFSLQHPEYPLRHSVRCGLTGYAQIHGWRGATGIKERLDHDLHYVENWSLALDLKILFQTLFHGWSERTRNGLSS